ncbi:MAG: vitamin K epoxide reductase family protein [Pyrinomonadaceae bacterium]|nr:vitamin K epoxide reductase family protein [Pyrinomonadaceae bacterium]
MNEMFEPEVIKVSEARAKRSAVIYAVAGLLALAGLADSIYLAIEHVAGRDVRCTVTTGCNEVLDSSYASLPGDIPLAALGAVAYFAAFSLATLAAFGYVRARPLLAALVASMFMTTLWLLFVQAFVIRKFCEFCLLSAAMTASLTGLIVYDWWKRASDHRRESSSILRSDR